MRRIFIVVFLVAVVAAACGGRGDATSDRAAAVDDSVEAVTIDDDEVTVEFTADDGGGSLVAGGGAVPAGFPLPVPDGGEITSSFTQGPIAALTISYPPGTFDDLVAAYADWLGANAAQIIVETRSTEPRVAGWSGRLAAGGFTIAVQEEPSGETFVILNTGE